MPTLLEKIKQAAMEAVKASEPADFVFGTVISEKPLNIQVDQKLILTAEFLFLTSNVMEYSVKAKMFAVESDGDGVEKQKMTVYNGLQNGDKVIMLKQQGGQKYVVLDKIIQEADTK